MEHEVLTGITEKTPGNPNLRGKKCKTDGKKNVVLPLLNWHALL